MVMVWEKPAHQVGAYWWQRNLVAVINSVDLLNNIPSYACLRPEVMHVSTYEFDGKLSTSICSPSRSFLSLDMPFPGLGTSELAENGETQDILHSGANHRSVTAHGMRSIVNDTRVRHDGYSQIEVQFIPPCPTIEPNAVGSQSGNCTPPPLSLKSPTTIQCCETLTPYPQNSATEHKFQFTVATRLVRYKALVRRVMH